MMTTFGSHFPFPCASEQRERERGQEYELHNKRTLVIRIATERKSIFCLKIKFTFVQCLDPWNPRLASQGVFP